jgi:anti-sigma factor RsiW
MNTGPRGAATVDMLAYVDDCLTSQDRRALEATLAHDSEARNQVDRWLAQNEAIRAAFSAPPARPFASDGAALRKLNFAADRKVQSARPLRQSKDSARRSSPDGSVTSDFRKAKSASSTAFAPGRETTPAGARLALARRVFATLLGAAAILAASAAVFSDEPSAASATAGIGAYRTFADSATRPVEIATSDRGALDKWFSPQIGRLAPVPDLSGSGMMLLGGRVVPGALSPAAFLVYESQSGERLGLEMEAIDSPPPSDVEMREIGDVACALWTADGHRFVLVGRASPARLAELARLIRLGQLEI